jgi:uncharacterized membrane protein required for colicin V production
MLLDILIFIPLLLCILFGIRDGIVRKLVAIIVMVGALIAGQFFRHDVGTYLTDAGVAKPENASLFGFLLIFFGLLIVQGLFYKIVAKNYKIGGIADRIGGLGLGLLEGILFASCMLLVLATFEFPDSTMKRDSSFYATVVNIAPQILDMTTSLESGSLEQLEEFGKEKIKNIHSLIDTSAVARQQRKQGSQMDSVRNSARKTSP